MNNNNNNFITNEQEEEKVPTQTSNNQRIVLGNGIPAPQQMSGAPEQGNLFNEVIAYWGTPLEASFYYQPPTCRERRFLLDNSGFTKKRQMKFATKMYHAGVTRSNELQPEYVAGRNGTEYPLRQVLKDVWHSHSVVPARLDNDWFKFNGRRFATYDAVEEYKDLVYLWAFKTYCVHRQASTNPLGDLPFYCAMAVNAANDERQEYGFPKLKIRRGS